MPPVRDGTRVSHIYRLSCPPSLEFLCPILDSPEKSTPELWAGLVDAYWVLFPPPVTVSLLSQYTMGFLGEQLGERARAMKWEKEERER